MTTYNRISVPMGSGKAVLEYGDRLCRVTMQLQGIGTDKLYKPYLLFSDSYAMLSAPLNIDRLGRCIYRCQADVENPEDIRAIAVISEDLQVLAMGYVNGEYDWRKCFMMNEKVDENKKESIADLPADENKADADEMQGTDTKQAFKSIVCHLNDDLQELKQYAKMPQFDNSKALFDTHEHIMPFYGCSESDTWIKINLRELAQVNSLWKYMNNPLVLYACKKYHYLLLGKRNGVLMLGVPWEYDSSYQLEAGIQGFTDVKPVQNVPLAKGEMCYLLLTL